MFFHSASAIIMAYAFHCLEGLPIDDAISSQYGGHFQFLTIHGLLLAWITMVSGSILDLFPSVPFLKGAKRLFSMLSMPLSITISSIYWTLMAVFPALLLPPTNVPPLDASPAGHEEVPLLRIPLSIDLGLHAVPAIVLLVDFFAFETKYSRKAVMVESWILAGIYASFYASWAEFCATHNDGIYPYPFLTVSPLWGRVLIYIGATTISLSSFRFLNYLHS
ncbi:hypothetical protein BDN72DRAFT_754561 [Pluteus cervinus]|uniref:Uncharacterized protein n=1 Tax=Pluteus cervinus TaxID=181527 RepID=A0ACD3BHB5_9AGAR|nr:hypothetical protein BDN72DRAFT_754561 [Pluteus cervinus]